MYVKYLDNCRQKEELAVQETLRTRYILQAGADAARLDMNQAVARQVASANHNLGHAVVQQVVFQAGNAASVDQVFAQQIALPKNSRASGKNSSKESHSECEQTNNRQLLQEMLVEFGQRKSEIANRVRESVSIGMQLL